MDFGKINEQIVATGVWWFDPWWEDDEWYITCPQVKTDIVDAVEFLKKIFSADWGRALGSEPLRHIFLKLLFGEGRAWAVLNSLIGLAARLKYIQNLEGSVSVLKAYKTIENGKSADLEIFLAYVLGKAGYHIKFIKAKPSKGKTPDILAAIDGKEFVVECKSLDDAGPERWIEGYSLHFAQIIGAAIPSQYEISYELTRRDIDPEEYGGHNLVSYQLAALIDTYPVTKMLADISTSKNTPAYLDVGRAGKIWLMPKKLGLSGVIEIPDLSNSYIGRRLIQNGLMKAGGQIKSFEKPGVAAIFHFRPPEVGTLKIELRKIFEKYSSDYRYLIGVLVFPAQNIINYIQPIWIVNPFSDFSPADFSLPDSLKKIIDPIVY